MIHHDPRSRSSILGANAQSDIARISQEQQMRIVDNENALELMPEIEWACRVLISSMLSPKDMTKRELIYSIEMDWLPPEIRLSVIDLVRTEVEKTYNYSDSLYPIFKDALFAKGSHPRLILPEAAVDKIINSGTALTMESIKPLWANDGKSVAGKGLLGARRLTGPTAAMTMESFRRVSEDKAELVSEEPLSFDLIHSASDDPVVKDKDKKGYVVPAYTADAPDAPAKAKEFEWITITDNVDALKMASYMDALATARRDEVSGLPEPDFGDFDFGVTAATKEQTHEGVIDPNKASPKAGLTNQEFRHAVFKSAPNNMVTHLRIPGVEALPRRSVGRPLVSSLPPESVMVIHAPGDPRKHLGYIVVHDETGHPLSMHGAQAVIGRASMIFDTTGSSGGSSNNMISSMVMSKAARNMSAGKQVTTFQELAQIYEKIVEEDVVTRMKNGAYPNGAELADANDLYTLMLARTLCSMRTRLVFVPREYITYFAFDYHHNGMGRSLLDTNKMLISARAGLMLSRMNAELRNSINVTEVLMKIDADDQDPEKRIEQALDIISGTRQPQYPLQTLSVNDIQDYLHRAGFVLKFAEHPGLPDTGFEFSKQSLENKVPSQEFYDSLGRQLYLGMGLPPELMDNTWDPEFATSLISRNIMFSQTILELQKIASGLMCDDVRRLVLADATILNGVTELVKESWGKIGANIPVDEKEMFANNPKKYARDMISRMVNSIYVGLPSPDITTLSNQMEAVKQYSEALDVVLPNYVSEQLIAQDMGAEIVGKVSVMLPVIKAALMRDFLADNAVLPELGNLIGKDEEGKPAFPLLDKVTAHLEGLMPNIMAFAKGIQPLEQAVAKDAASLALGTSGEVASSSTPGGGGGFGGFNLGDSGTPPESDAETSLELESDVPPPEDDTPPAE